MKIPHSWQVGLVLSVGVLSVSTAAIWVRLAIEAAGSQEVGFSLFLAASRLIIAAIILLPNWRPLKQPKVCSKAYYYAFGAGVFLAFHFAAWMTSLSYTSIAASTTIVTTNPIWVGLLSWIFFQEKPTKLTVLGIGIALMGGFILVLGDIQGIDSNSNPLLGDFLALIGAWMVSLYLLLGRESQRAGFSINSYITIAYTVAAAVLLPLPWLWGAGYTGYPAKVYLYVFLMAIFAQLIGHTSFNWALRWLSPTLVTLAMLFEPVGASLLGIIFFQEVLSKFVVLGSLVLLVGVATAVIGVQRIM